jgi:pSer/pThr/pTyr-binding forkhead associated (FHA) protein
VGQHQGREPLSLNRSFTLIGSTASARLYLPSKAISRCHAVVINTGGGLFVRDLASRTQTRINGQIIDEADLREGDVLQVGAFTFRFTDPTAPKVKPPALPAPPAQLEVDGLDEPLPVRGRTTLIGRRETADISLTETSASSAHTLLFVLEGRHLIRDLSSRTGSFVNGVKVHEQVLSPGDVLRVGETSFRYVRLGGAAEEPAAPPGQAGKDKPAGPAPAPPGGSGNDAEKIELEAPPRAIASDAAPSPVTPPEEGEEIDLRPVDPSPG